MGASFLAEVPCLKVASGLLANGSDATKNKNDFDVTIIRTYNTAAYALSL